jgi:hypothetical protein
MDGFPVPSIETITPSGLVVLFVLLLFFERIVPIGRVRDAQKAADILREANEKLAETNAVQAETNRLLVDGVGKTVEKVMSELQQRARDGSDA